MPDLDYPINIPMSIHGTIEIKAERWRLYYNRREAAPLVCSLDNGNIDSEFAVRQACLHNIEEVWTSWQPDSRASLRDPAGTNNNPVFCVEFDGILKLEHGVAHFYPSHMRGKIE